MKYTVILTEDNGNYQATVAGLPECSVRANSRSKALQTIGEAISRFIGHSEIVQLDVSAEPKIGSFRESIPWEWFGAFKDDPTWEELFAEIEHQRNSN